MDNLIDDILEYLKEARDKNWREFIIKCDLKRMINNYTQSELKSQLENVIEVAANSNSLNEFLDQVSL